jgi:hypothetical protein
MIKICLTFQVKVPFFTLQTHPVAGIPLYLIRNLSDLSRRRLLEPETNLGLLCTPSASPNPTVVLLQLSHGGRDLVL